MVAFRKNEKLASMRAIPEFLDLSDDNEGDLLTGENREERKCMEEQIPKKRRKKKGHVSFELLDSM